MYILAKRSMPSWEQHFHTQSEAALILRKFICKGCLEDAAYSHHILDLLRTDCGCEFTCLEE